MRSGFPSNGGGGGGGDCRSGGGERNTEEERALGLLSLGGGGLRLLSDTSCNYILVEERKGQQESHVWDLVRKPTKKRELFFARKEKLETRDPFDKRAFLSLIQVWTQAQSKLCGAVKATTQTTVVQY